MGNAEEKILEIKVRYDKAITKIAEYSTELDKLKAREKQLKEDVSKGRIEREKYKTSYTPSLIKFTFTYSRIFCLNGNNGIISTILGQINWNSHI